MESYKVISTMLDVEDVLKPKTLSVVKPLCKIIDDIIDENDEFQLEAELVDNAVLLKIIIPSDEELQIWDTFVIRAIVSYSDKIIIQTNEREEVEIISEVNN